MPRIYLDSALLIYLVEGVQPYADTLQARLSAPEVVQVCSDLTRLECRVKPLRDTEPALLAAFDRYFSEIIAAVQPLSPAVIDRATALRAQYGFRTADAIHLAAAILAGCDLFLTNDYRLEKCSEMTVELVQ